MQHCEFEVGTAEATISNRQAVSDLSSSLLSYSPTSSAALRACFSHLVFKLLLGMLNLKHILLQRQVYITRKLTSPCHGCSNLMATFTRRRAMPQATAGTMRCARYLSHCCESSRIHARLVQFNLNTLPTLASHEFCPGFCQHDPHKACAAGAMQQLA